MGKKRERAGESLPSYGSRSNLIPPFSPVAKNEDGPKKKHKKSKHRKHHKSQPAGEVDIVEASPRSKLTLKIKLGDKVIGTR